MCFCPKLESFIPAKIHGRKEEHQLFDLIPWKQVALKLSARVSDSKQAQIKERDWVLRGLCVICWHSAVTAQYRFLIFHTIFGEDDGQWVQSNPSRTIQTNFIIDNVCMSVCLEPSEDKLAAPFLLLCYWRLLTHNQLYLFSLAGLDWKRLRPFSGWFEIAVPICDLEWRFTMWWGTMFYGNIQTNMMSINTDVWRKLE